MIIPVKLSTIRSRLIFWLSLSSILIFTLLTVLLNLFLGEAFQSQIDHHIHVVTNEAGQIVQNYQGNERENLLKQLVSTQGMTIVLLSSDGTVLLQTNSSDVALASQAELEKLLTSPTTSANEIYHFNIGSLRFMTMPVSIDSTTGILAVGYSLKLINEAFKNMLLILSLVMAVALALLIIGSNYLIKRYLLPLEIISKQASAVSGSKDLQFNLDGLETTSEILTLKQALNTMARKIQKVFITEHHFFSDTAHTLKTPLAVIRSQVEALPLNKAATKKTLLASIDKQREIIDDLLLISRLETQPLDKNVPLNLSLVLDELSDIAETLASVKDISVEKSIENNVMVKANKNLLNRALGNIIQNAVNYARNQDTITISLTRKGQIAVICISDNGPGIAKADMPYIFNRFYRGRHTAAASGSGLGLAITKAVIDSLDGQIYINSKKNQGTKVTIMLNSTG